MIVTVRRPILIAFGVLILLSAGSPSSLPLCSRRADAVRRRGAARRVSLAQHRPQSRRPFDCGRRRQGSPARGVLRRRRRRAVEDHRRRQHLGARHRRSDHELLGRRRRRLGIESRRRLHRHGRIVHPRQHHARRRRLQVDRRGQDVGEDRLRQRRRHLAEIRIHPTNPDIVYVAAFGQYYGPSDERGVFKSTDGGKTWRRTLFRDPRTGAVDLAIDANNPNVIFAALWEAYRIEYQMSSGGPGSGLFKSTDGGETWTEITRNQGLPSGRRRPHRRRADQGRFESRLRARRERKGRPLRVGRRRRDVAADERVAHRPPARLLLHARARRPAQQGRRLHAQHRAVPLDRRRQDASPRSARARTAIITICGSTRTTPSTSSTAMTAAARSASTSSSRAAHVERSGLSDRAVVSRGHDRAPALPRVRRAAGQQHAVRAEQHQCGRWRLRRRAAGRAVSGRRRRARLHRARPHRSGRVLRRRQQRHLPDALQPAHRRAEGSRRLSALLLGRAVEGRQGTLAVDLPDHLFATSIRRCSTRARSACGGRPTAATRGKRSAATSAATIRRRSRNPAVRSRTT